MFESKKAYMRAVREICGLSQSDIAAEFDLNIRTVKRWEHPDWSEPPEDVLEWLATALDEHAKAVEEVVSCAISNAKPNETVVLNWYRDQAQRDHEGGVDAPYTFDNAITRSAAEHLMRLGYNVVFAFPDQEMAAREIDV